MNYYIYFIRELVAIYDQTINCDPIYKETSITKKQSLKNKYHYLNTRSLFEEICKQNLVFYFKDKNFINEYLPDLKNLLLKQSEYEIKKNQLISCLTKEISNKFIKEKFKFLVIKGIPLSYQISEDIYSRGLITDLDIVIEFSSFFKVIDFLNKEGFQVQEKYSIHTRKSIYGRYARFVNPEITLIREKNKTYEYIDLHWKFSWVSNPILDFKSCFINKQNINVDGQIIPTLNLKDAFIHSCCHAAYDNWLCIRNLVDIKYIFKFINKEDYPFLRKYNSILLSTHVCSTIFDSTNLKKLSTKNKFLKRYCEKRSLSQQSLPWRKLGKNDWSIKNRFLYLINSLLVSNNLKDQITFLLICLVPTTSLIDKNKNKERNIFMLILFRFKALRKRNSQNLIKMR